MVNEHLDEESHWLRHLLLIQMATQQREREKKNDGHGGGREEGKHTEQGETREGRKRRSKRPVKDEEIKGICLVKFDIIL